MRTVSFVEKLQFEFPGSLFNQALALGDVDNDLVNMLFGFSCCQCWLFQCLHWYKTGEVFICCLPSFLVI